MSALYIYTAMRGEQVKVINTSDVLCWDQRKRVWQVGTHMSHIILWY